MNELVEVKVRAKILNLQSASVAMSTSYVCVQIIPMHSVEADGSRDV